MASVQEPGTVRIVAHKPTGEEVTLYVGDVSVTAPGGGSPEGAGASTPKINERLHVPVHKAILRNNDIIYVEFTAVGADGIDVSDSLWAIPLVVNGTVKHIAQGDFADPAAADYTTVADIPVRVAGYKITEGPCQFGGGSLYVDIQDDTA
jgi:hypothetical protein